MAFSYAEGLAEGMDRYVTTTGLIKWLAWPARGMAVDPGIHLFGWSHEKAIAFMVDPGLTEERGDVMLARAALVTQLMVKDSLLWHFTPTPKFSDPKILLSFRPLQKLKPNYLPTSP